MPESKPTQIQEFPELSDIEQLIPKGRRPYMIARSALSTTIDEGFRGASAIKGLALAQEKGILDPPLPKDLEEVVLVADQFIDEAGQPLEGFDNMAASYILQAAIENGYRR